MTDNWLLNHLVVTAGRASGPAKVYHHPDCYVLERAIFTIDQTLLLCQRDNPDARPCKICSSFQATEFCCPRCLPPEPMVRAGSSLDWHLMCIMCGTKVERFTRQH